MWRFTLEGQIDPGSGTGGRANLEQWNACMEIRSVTLQSDRRIVILTQCKGTAGLATGACPAGTIGVRRAYNGRFAVNDSNHRYTTSDVVYSTMLASECSGEGVVFRPRGSSTSPS